MLIKRALTVPFPKVWSKFQRTHNGKTHQFEIREAKQQEEKEKLIDLVCEVFMRDEPTCVAFRIIDDKLAVKELAQLLRNVLKYDFNGICFDVTNRNDPKFAAGNIFMHVDQQKEPIEPEAFKSEPIKNLIKLIDMTKEAKNIFKTYNVTHYLQGIAVTTDPAYRNLGLGTEMISARDSVCKAFGIPLSAIMFTGAASQRVGEKAGYKTYATLDYKDLNTLFSTEFKSTSDCIKITAKPIDL